jgi:heme/copper-type cytochrome/quinol oxidase subunit 2
VLHRGFLFSHAPARLSETKVIFVILSTVLLFVLFCGGLLFYFIWHDVAQRHQSEDVAPETKAGVRYTER